MFMEEGWGEGQEKALVVEPMAFEELVNED